MRNDPLATGRSIFWIVIYSIGLFIYYLNEHIVFHIANMFLFFCVVLSIIALNSVQMISFSTQALNVLAPVCCVHTDSLFIYIL